MRDAAIGEGFSTQVFGGVWNGIGRRIVLLALLVAGCLMPWSASAQLSTASVFGTVADSTGASIPNASVVLTQTNTNIGRTVATDSAGAYRADFLPIGPYKITISAQGFKTLEQGGILLTVTEQAKLDFSLAVGGATDVVTVTAGVPLLNTGNSTLGRVVDNVEVDNLPLVNRNVYQLLSLTPGVQANVSQTTLGFPEQHVYINGSTDSAVGQVAYYLDGGLNMTGLRNTGNALPNPDAIQEFAVQTNNFSAQYGRSSAGIVTVLTKSGTNNLHGSVFEFYRSKNFNATTHASTAKSNYVQHRFGATIGGPIKKDKTFFFGSFGGLRYVTSTQLTSQVPTAAQRTGDFSANLPVGLTTASTCATPISAADAAAGKFIVCNPVTRVPYRDASGRPSNIITDPLDPTIQKIMSSNLPLPNPSLATDSVYQRRDQQPLQQSNNEFLGKGDHQLTPTQRVTLSYFQQKGSQTVVPAGSNVANWSLQTFQYRQQNASVSHTWALSPRTVNQIWLNYTRQIGGRVNLPAKTLADFGSSFITQGTPNLPQIGVSGFFTLGEQIAGPKAGANVYGFRDVVSTSKRGHTLAIGGEVTLEKDAQQTLLNNYGVFAFVASTSARTGNALSDFILGRPNTMLQASPVYANANYFNYGAFVQDDWRILPNLTLNIGLRYDIQTAPTDTQRRQLNFKPGVQSTSVPSAPAGLLFPGDAGVPETGTTTPYNHVSPRVGFSLDPLGNGKTVFHGAAGLFFGTISGNEFELPSNGIPYALSTTYSKVVSITNPYQNDPTEFPGGVSPFPYIYDKATPRFPKPSGVIAFDPNYRWPYIYQMNLGFQQQLANDLVLSVNYVGSLDRKLPIYNDPNYPIFNVNAAGAPGASCADLTQACGYANTTGTVNNRRPFNQSVAGNASLPTYSNVYVITSSQNSNYHGLQILLEKRLSKNFSVKGFYTWSKTLASIGLNSNSLGTAFEDYNLRRLDKQRSDYDVRHQSVTSAVWKPDYFGSSPALVRGILNGWTMTAIVTVQSGTPFTITNGADSNADGNSNDRPNVIPGKTAQLLGARRSRVEASAAWFDPTAFCAYNIASPSSCPGVGPAGSDGTLSPNLLSSPGVRNIDASIFRDFGIYERVKFQLRGESTNVFNLTNLGTPTASISSGANFGKILGSNNTFGNRIIQVGGRILF